MSSLKDFRAETLEQCDTNIAVGDLVRSYDFEFRDDCWVTGRVEAVGIELGGCPRYQIMPTSRTVEGELQAVSLTPIYPPVNGTPHIIGGFCNGVRKILEDSDGIR